jgi:hypothetical protein
MTYEKPAIVEVGSALKAVQGVKKSSNHPDAGGDIATSGAYEVDE